MSGETITWIERPELPLIMIAFLRASLIDQPKSPSYRGKSIMNTFRSILLAFSSILLASCSSFERDWDQSVADYQAGKISAPYGPWDGAWTTPSNGHSGDLRAIVKESPGNSGAAAFRYNATWSPIFQGTYSVDFPITRQGGTYYVDGSKSLGPFGKFGHKATISGNSFNASFSDDKGALGQFNLRRP
tara:strand:+ start:149 stop:712 length:564 start_codon:yes stop_codon:yes gene_type:complete